MGSTVVVVFEAPVSKCRAREEEEEEEGRADFGFCIRAGDKVRMGEAIARWSSGSG
jgi:phosphatidylserine decarboxylase